MQLATCVLALDQGRLMSDHGDVDEITPASPPRKEHSSSRPAQISKDDEKKDVAEEIESMEVEEEEGGEESDPLASDYEPKQGPSPVKKTAGGEMQEEIFGASIDEIFAERSKARRGRKRRSLKGTILDGRKRPRTELPPRLSELMGTANLAYMNRDFKRAEKILANVIREAPRAVGPYHTLGLISEEKGDLGRALNYYMFAAHLQPSDRDLWKRNAAMSYELGNLEQATYCLTRAIRGTHGKDAELLLARARLFKLSKEYRKSADSYRKVLRINPSNIHVSLELAKMYQLSGAPKRSVIVLQEALEIADKEGSRENEEAMINLLELLAKLHIGNKKYAEASVLLQRIQIREQRGGRSLTFSQQMLVAICRYRLGSPNLAADMFAKITSTRNLAVRYKDLLWEVAEAYHDGGAHEEAISAYSILIDFEAYRHRPKLYLNRSSSYKLLGDEQKAKEDLERILEFSPDHTEASLRLARIKKLELQREKTMKARANKGIQSSSKKRPFLLHRAKQPSKILRAPRSKVSKARAREIENEARAILSAANAAYEAKNFSSYLNKLGPLLEASLQLTPNTLCAEDVRDDEEDDVDANGEEDEGRDDKEVRERIQSLQLLDDAGVPAVDLFSKKIVRKKKLLGKPSKPSFTASELGTSILRSLTAKDFVSMTGRVYNAMATQGRTAEAHELVSVLVSLGRSRLDLSSSRLFPLRLLLLATCIAGGKFAETVDECRVLLIEMPANMRLWYVLQYTENRLLQDLRSSPTASLSARYSQTVRFISRLLQKHEDCVPVILAAANRYGARNSHSHAIQMYLLAYRLRRRSAFICLCIGIQLLYVSMSRRVSNRNKIVLQAFAFLEEYRRLRTAQDRAKVLEAEYNLGRAAHQLGLMHLASKMYEIVLEDHDDLVRNTPEAVDLRREAAFNLSLVYQNSGSTDLAAMVLRKYLVF